MSKWKAPCGEAHGLGWYTTAFGSGVGLSDWHPPGFSCCQNAEMPTEMPSSSKQHILLLYQRATGGEDENSVAQQINTAL